MQYIIKIIIYGIYTQIVKIRDYRLIEEYGI